MTNLQTDDLKTTALTDLHIELGAKMTGFAGYNMPTSFPLGVLKEHLHTREKAGLFDVSHMGQVVLWPKSGEYADVALAFEEMVPVDVLGLASMRQRYGFFTNDAGGIDDDLMFANLGNHIFVVVNAACKDADIARMQEKLGDRCRIEVLDDRALLALQGPKSVEVLAALAPEVAAMRFMDVAEVTLDGASCVVSRSGYTGEDGYEISVEATQAEALARTLLAHPDVEAIGLGARDSLRLEAGLCLYGHDIDSHTTPASANLNWAIQKVRRKGGDRQGGFTGADKILAEFEIPPEYLRVGLAPEGRAPMRGGVQVYANEADDLPIGLITSGGFGPSHGAPVAMGYVTRDLATTGTRVFGDLRGKRMPIRVAALPFIPANFKK